MRLRRTLWAGLLLTPLAGSGVLAADRANYDAFLARQEDKGLVVQEDTLHARGLRVTQTEDRLGVPSFVWSTRAGTGAGARAIRSRKPDAAAREHLQSVADLYRLGSEDVSNAVLKSVHQTGRGPVIARFTQQVDGIEVFSNEVKVIMDQNLELVALSGYLAPGQSARKAGLTAASDFRLSAEQAIAVAFQDQTGISLPARGFVANGQENGPYSYFEIDKSSASVLTHALAVPARAKQVYFTLPDGLVPAWYVEVNTGRKDVADSSYRSYVVSAVDGSLLMSNDLGAHVNPTGPSNAYRYKVWADPVSFIPYDGPHGNDTTPYAPGIPDGVDVKLTLPPNSITLSSSPFSRNDPWLPAGSTETVGNNVDAYADLSNPDGFQQNTLDVRATLMGDPANPGFDYVYDLSKAPGADANQRQAAITNLFYITNWLHDWFYDAGFDEAAGNAQALNFGRGGVEGDRMRVEAQDVSGTNNANMYTPADGAPPRMQMYVFGAKSRFETTVNTPAGLKIDGTAAQFGAQGYDVTADVVVGLHGTVTDGCSTAAFTNAAEIAGKIALLDRGTCAFTIKAKNAQTAGAVGVLLANNAAGAIIPSGEDASITIPVVSVLQADGVALKSALTQGTVNVRLNRLQPGVARDGTLDNGIIAHEWGHYISNRLVGDGNGLRNAQGSAMGEGWADFHAMLMQVQESDRNVPGNNLYQGVYSVAAYTQSGPGVPGAYYGIRRVPYSSSFTKNALTFKHISNGTPLPSTHPVNGTLEGRGNSEVHAAGEVWANMLWECYASLLNAYPFQEAQNRMKQYLVAGYKATPSSPTYVEARDALLSVVKASDPADYERFVGAFARRGMGFGAKAPDRDSQDFVGVVESYERNNNLEVVSIRLDDSINGCDQDGVLDVGEEGYLSVTVRNVGRDTLSSSTATVSTSGESAVFEMTGGTTLSFPTLAPSQTATARLRLKLLETTTTEPRAGISVMFNEPSLPTSAKTTAFNARVNTDESLGSSNKDTVNGQATPWVSSLVGSSTPIWQRREEMGNRFWHGPNLPTATTISLTSPWMEVLPDADFIFSYQYRHSLESENGTRTPWYDGAVLEVSTDGLVWKDVTDYGVAPGYGADAIASTANPLNGRKGYVGPNVSFPAFDTATLNFGKQFAGKRAQFRFRIGTDSGAGAYGLDLDDLQFMGTKNTPFGGPVTEAFAGPAGAEGAPACNRRPVAGVGNSQSVVNFTLNAQGAKVYTKVFLDGSSSMDPDGDKLTYTWTQLTGPLVTLTDANTARPSFTPMVAEDAVLVFQLVVNDSKESSLPVNTTVVVDTDRDPVVNAGADRTVPGRTTTTLDGVVTDPDNDPIAAYQWVQTGGPTVTLANRTTAKASFTSPDVKTNTQLTFDLYASAKGLVAKDTVVLTVLADQAPVAKAGDAQNVDARSTVTLQASATDPENDSPITYAWTQVSGTPMVELTGANTAMPTFTAPDVRGAPVELVFQVVASANGQSSQPATVTVTVHKLNRRPVVMGPNDLVVDERTLLELSAEGVDPDGEAISYRWAQTGGPVVALTGIDTAKLKFTSPEVLGDTLLTFSLMVKDTDGAESEAVTVKLTVKDVNRAPVALPRKIAGGAAGASITLDASGSTDADGDTLTYKWTQLAGPSVTLTPDNGSYTSFVADKKPAEYAFELTVTDGKGMTSKKQVNVVTTEPESSGMGCASTGTSGQSSMVSLLLLGVGMLFSRRRANGRG